MRNYELFFLAAAVISAGCGLQKADVSTNASVSSGSTTNPATLSALGQQAFNILQANCASCHGPNGSSQGGINYILDFNALITSGLAIPGNASGSRIYTDMKNGVMPPTGGISSADLTTIYNWIQTDLKAGSPQPSPSPTPSSSPSSSPLAATYSSISTNILTPYCVGCHNANRAAGGYSYASYTSTLASVTKGSPSQSRLYTACSNGSMPQGGPRLDSTQLQAISTWITNGAMNN